MHSPHLCYNTQMDLTSPKIIKEILEKFETRADKRLGQNFLIDKNALQKVVDASDIKSDDIVLEVGPGIGVLTQELAKKANKIIAVEKDKTMIEILKETLSEYKNIEIINADILKLDPKIYALNPYKVVANIPYYLTSLLIRKFLESKNPPTKIILMLQKEVAQRICAKPGKMSLLSVSVQFYAEPKIVSYISKNCFWPAPKVDSAIIKIIPRSQTSRPTGGLTSPDSFFKVVKAGFSQPRKQLLGNLAKMLKLDKKEVEAWLSKNNIKPTQRAETLSVEDWQNLTNSFL
jgi:16S rRNA (adenine1518-N6/adenine1519-N6)-dimethyltransferase